MGTMGIFASLFCCLSEEKESAMGYEPHVFLQLGLGYIANRPPSMVPRVFEAEESSVADDRRFRACFGASPGRCTDVWRMINPVDIMPRGVQPHHLLWALLFLKVYATETVLTAMVDSPDEKTFRKWCRLFVVEISWLEIDVVCESTVTVLCRRTCFAFGLRVFSLVSHLLRYCHRRFASKTALTATFSTIV